MLLRHTGIRTVAVAGALLFICASTYLFLIHGNPDWKVKSTTWLSNLGDYSGGELLPMTEPISQAGLNQDPTRPIELIHNAHTLLTADAFLPHFQALMQIKGLTMAEAKSSCSWGEDEGVNFQYYEKMEWVKQDRSDKELQDRRSQWHHFISNELLSYRAYKSRFKGRGIVILAGNGSSLKRVRVILRQLKRLGSQLPVEIHFWGEELPVEAQESISVLWPKLYFNDLSAPSNIIKSNNNNFFHVNYQLKTAAVLNSRFAEPLLLDSDNIPIIDPESLYESETYKEYGTLFWPDIARTRPNNPMWPITNTHCRMDEYEQESGQLIVDKRRFFYHLQLAAWFNTVNTGYYNEFLLGDKDMFRFAWHALKTKYGAPPKWITSVGTVSPDGFYCGHSFAQHHPNGSVAFLHGGLLKTIPKAVIQWQRDSRGGIFQSYKRSVVDEQHRLIEKVAIKLDGAMYMPNRPKDLKGEMCTDMSDVHPRKLDEIVPGFQKTFEEIGGYWMLDDREDSTV